MSAHEPRIGCSGWNYAHWRNGVFYPPRCAQRNWLEFYARHFDTVEVNSTFYRLPREPSVARRLEQTPEGFTFAVKVSRYVTHIKRLADVGEHLPLLYAREGDVYAYFNNDWEGYALENARYVQGRVRPALPGTLGVWPRTRKSSPRSAG